MVTDPLLDDRTLALALSGGAPQQPTAEPVSLQPFVDIYKLYVEMADRTTARRLTTNSFFLTIQTGLITAFGFAGHLFDRTSELSLSVIPSSSLPAALLIPIAGIVLCLIWRQLLLNFHQLQGAKFRVIHEMEQTLPLRPYAAERAALNAEHRRRATVHFEGGVAVVFLVLHALLFVGSLPWQEILERFRTL